MLEAHLVSEPVTPVPGSIELDGMARGLPGLPKRFLWRGREASHRAEQVSAECVAVIATSSGR